MLRWLRIDRLFDMRQLFSLDRLLALAFLLEDHLIGLSRGIVVLMVR